MSLDPAAVEAAVRRNDATEVRDLLRGATEPERRACARTLKALFDGPRSPFDDVVPVMLPPQEIAWIRLARAGRIGEVPGDVVARWQRAREKHARIEREYEAWLKIRSGLACQLAVLGLAGGAAAASRAIGYFHGSWQEAEAEVEAVAGVLGDRRPEWLADFVEGNLTAQFYAGVGPWPLARKLVRLGAIERPDVGEYTTLLPRAMWRTEGIPGPEYRWRQVKTPAQALLDDPGLLDDEVWRLFTVPDAAKELEGFEAESGEWIEGPVQTWSQALAQLAEQGHLDRGRLIDACLDAFTRDFGANRVAWYAIMHRRLDPSPGEMAARAGKYRTLLGVAAKPGVTLGREATGKLYQAGLLDAGRLIEASRPALLFPQKSVVTAQLKLIGTIMKRDPAACPQAAAVVAVAFGHERQDVQEAALALLSRHGVPAGAPLAEMRLLAGALSPSLAAEAAALGLGPDVSAAPGDDLADAQTRIAALPADAADSLRPALDAAMSGDIAGPAAVAPSAGDRLADPVTDPDELVHLLVALMEDARDAVSVERAMAGAVRLSGLPPDQRRRAAAPLLRRAEALIDADYYGQFGGGRITADMARIAHAWGTGRLYGEDHREYGWSSSRHLFAVDASGSPVTMAGIFSARAWESAKAIATGRGGVLLAEPESGRGAISQDRLLERVAWHAGRAGAGGPTPGRHDFQAAVLRLAPDAGEGFWSGWGSLDRHAALSARASYRLVNSALSFEPVLGRPRGRPLRGYGEWEEQVLARIPGPVPVATRCPSWQLLTALSDPLRDHARLYGPRWDNRHYDASVAAWPLICPWQPELAAAHLLRAISDGLRPGPSPASTAIGCLAHPGHPLGPVGHLALICGLASGEADTRVAAASLWSQACADGRLDPDLAAAALGAVARSDAVKLSRIADALRRAAHQALPGWRIVQTVCAAADVLSGDSSATAPPGAHQLIELAARLGAEVGVPAVPAAFAGLAARRSGSRLAVTAKRLSLVAGGPHPRRAQAAAEALGAILHRAETPWLTRRTPAAGPAAAPAPNN